MEKDEEIRVEKAKAVRCIIPWEKLIELLIAAGYAVPDASHGAPSMDVVVKEDPIVRITWPMTWSPEKP